MHERTIDMIGTAELTDDELDYLNDNLAQINGGTIPNTEARLRSKQCHLH